MNFAYWTWTGRSRPSECSTAWIFSGVADLPAASAAGFAGTRKKITYVTSVTATNSTTAQRSRRTRYLTIAARLSACPQRGCAPLFRTAGSNRSLRRVDSGRLRAVIDLRSDTATRPSAEMRAAIAGAEVGDEQKREDPTVAELERRGAELLGQEEAVFLPTATMANQIALRVLGEPGDELLAEENCHILLSELGGAAVHSGLVTRGLPGHAGRFSPEQVRAAFRDRTAVHSSPTRLASVENTHNSSGGRVWPLEEIAAVVDTCRELDMRVHLDGARLLNASVASGVAAAEIARRFDTVTLCLSKGLGCPLGALLAGSGELMAKARRGKHLFGGAMRQAGIVAAAGVYALDHNVERLADDHARARRLAEACHAAGRPRRPRAGRDELRAGRLRPARPDARGGARPAARARRAAVDDRAPDRPAGGHPPRRLGRRRRARVRARPARAGAPCSRLSSAGSRGGGSPSGGCRA